MEFRLRGSDGVVEGVETYANWYVKRYIVQATAARGAGDGNPQQLDILLSKRNDSQNMNKPMAYASDSVCNPAPHLWTGVTPPVGIVT